jgi:hypothetical protein
MKKILTRIGQCTHQGDIFLRKIENNASFDDGKLITPNTNGTLIVQKGEGLHCHMINDSGKVKLKSVKNEAGVKVMYLLVDGEVKLVHGFEGDIKEYPSKAPSKEPQGEQNHDTITLTPGLYEVRTQREQNHALGFLRPVSD